MPSRDERVAENEAMFRVINERLASWSENREAPPTEKIDFYCECGNKTCFERVRLTNPEYEAIRADAARFAVVPGHVFPDAEHVVEHRHGYLVVEKNEHVRHVVERLAPHRPAKSS
jgi:hypothetical protein